MNVHGNTERLEIRGATLPFQGAVLSRSCWQIANSFVGYLLLCVLMYWSLRGPYIVTLLLAVLAAGFVVRIFIIQHDCGHGSFFRSRRANSAVGTLCSLITFTPYPMWRRQHGCHHADWNNLDRRLSGTDIYSGCVTVAEYESWSPARRLGFRILQHPIVAWGILPPAVFLLLYRLPFDSPRNWRWERRSVHLTNLGLLIALLALSFTVGFRSVLLVQLPTVAIAAMIGVWLFSIQHRFEETVWARQDSWNVVRAALAGCSYLKLPRIPQWFTGNIGFHHIHHLNPGIPNYRLEACHQSNEALRRVRELRLSDTLSTWRFALWEEQAGRMVWFPSRRKQ